MKQSEFTILIDAKAYAKLRHWIKLASPDEVSCLGLVEEIRQDNRIASLLVTDIFLVEQIVNHAETTLDDKAVADLLIQLSSQGIDISSLKCWIHSHANLKVFWSETDDQCCSVLANGTYSVSIVTNARGDILARIDVYNPCHMTLDKVPTQVHYPIPDEMREFYAAEFQAKVKTSKPVAWTKTGKKGALSPANQDELEEALDQGYINIYEYQELAGFSVFDDVCGGG
jgi:hypothetical protein